MLEVVEPREASDPHRPQPITVVFDTPRGAVSGTVSMDGDGPAEFHGWLELMDELERLRAMWAADAVGKPG